MTLLAKWENGKFSVTKLNRKNANKKTSLLFTIARENGFTLGRGEYEITPLEDNEKGFNGEFGDQLVINPENQTWEWASAGGMEVKRGRGAVLLKKFLAKGRKSDVECYDYELRDVKRKFSRGYVNAFLFIPNNGAIVKVTPKNFERVKKMFNHYSKFGNA